jgi:hypothetical protein
MSDDLEILQHLYTENVTKKLNEAREHLSKVFPLTYRIEIVEDIFSLLFVTHEDMQQLVEAKHRCVCERYVDDLNETKVSGAENLCSEKSNRSSNHSTASTGDHIKIGFIANEFVVRDVLNFLKDALVNITADVYAVHKTKLSASGLALREQPEEESSATIATSVAEGEFHARLNQLTKLVHEATWRFQLVAKETISEDFDHIPSDPHHYSASDSDEKG